MTDGLPCGQMSGFGERGGAMKTGTIVMPSKVLFTGHRARLVAVGDRQPLHLFECGETRDLPWGYWSPWAWRHLAALTVAPGRPCM